MSFIASTVSTNPIITNFVNTGATSYTLSAKATIVKTVPTGYGQTVTLPSALLLTVGGPYFVVDNSAGAYPVLIRNANGDLVSFVFPGVTATITVTNAATVAGVWDVLNGELVGASAQLLTANIYSIYAVLDLGSNRDFILGRGTSIANLYGVVYNRVTNVFGAVTLIRTAAQSNSTACAIVSATDQILVCSVTANLTAFEAVTLTISGTTITVNTAATATLSANAENNPFANRGIVAAGGSFVISYLLATPAAQLRAISISGTAVTIGAATVLPGTKGGYVIASGSVAVVASYISNPGTFYVTPYTVSGSTLTIGTGANNAPGWVPGNDAAFFALGNRFVYVYYDANGVAGVRASLASLSGTTITLSNVTLFSSSNYQDAIILSNSKVLFLSTKTSLNANILTDTAGTASAGTAITLSSGSNRGCLSVSGTDAYIYDIPSLNTNYIKLDCSGANPVVTFTQTGATSTNIAANFSASSPRLVPSANQIYGTGYIQAFTVTTVYGRRVSGDTQMRAATYIPLLTNVSIAGRNNAERWGTDTSSLIFKVEAV